MHPVVESIKLTLQAGLEEATRAAAGLNRRTLAWGGLGLAAVTLLSVNLFATAALRGYTADVTEDGLYTISEGTRKSLTAVDEPIDVRVYFSRKLGDAAPNFAKSFERLRALDLLVGRDRIAAPHTARSGSVELERRISGQLALRAQMRLGGLERIGARRIARALRFRDARLEVARGELLGARDARRGAGPAGQELQPLGDRGPARKTLGELELTLESTLQRDVLEQVEHVHHGHARTARSRVGRELIGRDLGAWTR